MSHERPPTEWDAASYHRVSSPQLNWGQRVLARLPLNGHEHVIDAGCGTGRLTAELSRRLPHGRVTAADRSWNMLLTARANLRPEFGSRVRYVRVNLPQLPFASCADVVFSTATFHWVSDHDTLFRDIFRVLTAGGRLHAQCGGGPNLEHAHALAAQVMSGSMFRESYCDWEPPWRFATVADTEQCLRHAGFHGIEVSLEPAPVTLPDEASYREFVSTVVYHPHLARLPDPSTRAHFLAAVTALAAAQQVPFSLDYWRLNVSGRRA